MRVAYNKHKNISNLNDGSAKKFVVGFDELSVRKYSLTLSENEIIDLEMSHPNVRKPKQCPNAVRWHGRARTEISIGRKTPSDYKGCRFHQTKLKIWPSLERLEIGIWNMAQSTSAVWSRSMSAISSLLLVSVISCYFACKSRTHGKENTNENTR